ncbi:hypothetical protein GLOIN_2v1874127 [Rhizophagus clarus]|uniref:Ion transport domain-containing protein n=1 Tax=Rhizophagus clarus TaxID=94130 RepID=A0A8H3LD21_9GLOM|nr:hypothetical protein GLOIN_2v1874127 [Rhizophagus clarus]
MNEISVEIDKGDNINVVVNNEIDDKNNDTEKPHNGKPITMTEISPKGEYLVTYSVEDKSVVGWNVLDKGQLKLDNCDTIELKDDVYKICVSDDKIFACIYDKYKLKIIDMENSNKEIESNLCAYSDIYYDCTFNLKSEFIFHNDIFNRHGIRQQMIWIYSTKVKNNQWMCKGIYEIPDDFKLISISKYDSKFYLFSNKNIYEWDILTEKIIKIFNNEKKECEIVKSFEIRQLYDVETIETIEKAHEEAVVSAEEAKTAEENRLWRTTRFFKKCFIKDKKKEPDLDSRSIKKDIKISSNNKFICLKVKNKIIIYSIELNVPMFSFDINDDVIQPHNFMNIPDLYLLMFTLLLPNVSQDGLLNNETWNSIIKHCWKKCLGHIKKSQKELQAENLLLFDKHIFGILDGYIWKIELDTLKMNFSYKDFNELSDVNNNIAENLKLNNDNDIPNENRCSATKDFNKAEIYHSKYLNIHLFDPNLDIIQEIFKDDDEALLKPQYSMKSPTDSMESMGSMEWNVSSDKGLLKLRVNKIDDKFTYFKRVDKFNVQNFNGLLKLKQQNDNNIFILTVNGFYIYHFNERNESISLNYFYHMDLFNEDKRKQRLQTFREKLSSKSTLPLPNYDSFKLSEEWVYYVKTNKESLLKYGVELLSFAVKEHRLELIDDIYKNCMIYFKEDLSNNKMFLNIITSTMPLLNEYYPEYILEYSLKTNMIIDSFFYTIKHQSNYLHLYSFQYQIVNLTQSILWVKYITSYVKLFKHNPFWYNILISIQYLIIPFTLPILPFFFVIFHIMFKYHFIHDFIDTLLPTKNYVFTADMKDIFTTFYFYIVDKYDEFISTILPTTTTPTITFMISYIKFVNYPKEYNWFFELIRPKSSLFVEIISRDIYKTWNGEALINFKWNTFGKYYYIIIWGSFMALLGCFTAAATIPQQYINENVQEQLLIVSIILGFIHLSFEIRQFIYNPIKWIYDFWNLFDIIAYILPIFTSIYWLKTDDRNVHLLSFSCLFLDIKFRLFFRVFESFGVYFAIIISVAKQIISFLVVLFIIIISFAHAFYILLSPKEIDFSFDKRIINNDPNNPWNIAPTYSKVLDDGTIDSNPFIIQPPNENTNMFIDYGTALFAMYKFLTGDSSALSNWPYLNNPSLVILIVLFSLLIVVYLMNLFIGLLNIAIDEDNDRVSYLVQKAKILAEIELFYLLPHQRRKETWFPEVIYYYADVDKAREEVKKLIRNGQWDTDEFPELRQDLLKKLNIQDYECDQQLLKEIRKKQERNQESLEQIQKKQEDDQKSLEQIRADQKLLEEIRDILSKQLDTKQ